MPWYAFPTPPHQIKKYIYIYISDIYTYIRMQFFFFLGIIGAPHEGGGRGSREQGSKGCGYNGESPPGYDFIKSA